VIKRFWDGDSPAVENDFILSVIKALSCQSQMNAGLACLVPQANVDIIKNKYKNKEELVTLLQL
jgi:hypothetical protein